MRVAIATGAYANTRQTQIVFHIERLFGGARAVLAVERGDPDPYGLPVLILREERSLLSALRRPFDTIRSNLEYSTSRVPYGPERRRVESFLREHRIEAMLCEFGTVALAFAPVVRDMGLPVFAYYRGADVSSYLSSARRIEGYRRMMSNLDGVFSVSTYLLDRLATKGIVHPNSRIVPSGVDTALFAPGPKTPGRCLAVGRLIEKKQPALTVRAFCAVARNHPQAVLEMIGEGPLLAECEKVAHDAGMAERVVLHGQKPHDFVQQRMSECAVFLQHSITGRDGNTEGLPTSVQEAMACGMVVVSTRHAGIPEAVTEEETGFLVDEGDEAGFVRAIDRVLHAGPDALAGMSQRARDTAVARYDRSKLLKLVEAAMTEARDRDVARRSTPATGRFTETC